MPTPHSGQRRLGAAVAAVLTVTLAAGPMAAAPVGATGVTAATAGSNGLLPMVPGARLVSAGPRGILTVVPDENGQEKLRWTPYDGGAIRDIPFDSDEGIAEPSGDMVVTSSDRFGTKAVDMSTGASFGMRSVDDGMDIFSAGVAGHSIFIRGNAKLWVQDGDVEPRAVQGLPDGVNYRRVRPGDGTHGLLSTETAEGDWRVGLIDLTDATLTYPYPQQAQSAAISGNRLAWVEVDAAAHTLRAVVRDRTIGAETRTPMPGTTTDAVPAINLLGDWVTYGTTALRTGTREKVTLLDSVYAAYTTPDGTAQIVEGSSSAHGEGVFRVALGTDGRPVVRLLAHAGTPTSALHDFDDDGLADLLGRDASGGLWRDSAGDGRPRARIGGGWQIYDKIEAVGDIAGAGSPGFTPEVVARDKDGVLWLYSGREDGGFVKRVRIGAGWQTYTHITGGSDLTGDGRPDVTAVDTTGVLWLYRATGDTSRPFEPRQRVGAGWQVYNQLTAVGDLAGGPAGDLVARDKDGVLWLYLGKGDGALTRRTRIGGGWQTYSQLVGAGDVDHDGKADLFAYRSGTKTVYQYSGTGDPAGPFAPRAISDAQTGNAYDNVS